MRKEKRRRISMVKVMILILFIWNSALTFSFMNKKEVATKLNEKKEIIEILDFFPPHDPITKTIRVE